MGLRLILRLEPWQPIRTKILLAVSSVAKVRMIPPIRIVGIGVWIILPPWRGHVASHVDLFRALLLKHWAHISSMSRVGTDPINLNLLYISYSQLSDN